MILGALTDLLKDPSDFKKMIESAGIPGISVSVEQGDVFGISGTKVHISINGVEEGHEHEHGHGHAHHHHHEHHTLSNVTDIIRSLNVSEQVKQDACEIYGTIAEAESEAHGVPVDLVHFHEVGALDAVADIVGACMLIERLAPEQILASPVRVGYGQVKCAHGVLPVPAPATASIIKGIPVYAGDEEGEFCTPTGAAILKHFVKKFGQMPTMLYDELGIGLGSKVFRTANMLRAFVGDTGNSLPSIKEIKCNIDDMTSEDIGNIIELLLTKGALDAFIAPCVMKKGRPGFELTCLSRPEDAEELSILILAHTSTIGVRVHDCERYAMSSRFEKCTTEYGEIRIKVSEGFGLRKWKPEYEDVNRAAFENDVTLNEVRNRIRFDLGEE